MLHRRPALTTSGLKDLFTASWPDHGPYEWEVVRTRSLGWVAAYDDERLIGFTNIAGDGGSHAFLLDVVVRPEYRRSGVGRALVSDAAAMARETGARWLHVDFEEGIAAFYRACGFVESDAGLLRLDR
jgi:GNAT superfamily N-acetyltransferase